MIRALAVTALLLAIPAHAQYAYTQGYHAGYQDRFDTLRPGHDPLSDRARGSRDGQDDADDDDMFERRRADPWLDRE